MTRLLVSMLGLLSCVAAQAQAQVSLCTDKEEMEREGCKGREVRLCNADTQPRAVTVLSKRNPGDAGDSQTLSVPPLANASNGPRIGFTSWRDGTVCGAWEHSVVKIE